MQMPAPYNPRGIDTHNLDALRASLREFGPVQSVIVNTRTNHIVGGHQRVRAARAEGIEDFPVTYIDVTEQRERQLNIALNQIGGNWEDDLLRDVLKGLEAEGADLALTGFDDVELAILLGEPTEKEQEERDEAAEMFGAGTQIHRGSAPLRYWRESGHLEGDVLDFGCGEDQHDFARYDAFLHPDPAPLLESYDVVMCNYVLNVQPADHLITQIVVLISRLLRPGGRALFAVVSEKSMANTPACGNREAKSRSAWREILSQVFDVESVKDAGFAGFVCSSFADGLAA